MKQMVKVLIAYNNDINESSRNFFEDCAVDIRNLCYIKGIECQLLTPPKLREQEMMEYIYNSQICYIASHGRIDAIVNEKSEDVISTITTNYNFNGKALFAISCYCAQMLKDELMKIGLKLFVGYKSNYTEFPGYEEFYITANSGIKVFLEGASVSDMRNEMFKSFDDCYRTLDLKSSLAADALLDNKEGLIIDGDDQLCLCDLI